VCTGTNGVTISNTATLTPQQAGTNGVPIPVTANLQLSIWGCELPPDVTFQDLQSWGAQTFSWAMQKRATRWGGRGRGVGAGVAGGGGEGGASCRGVRSLPGRRPWGLHRAPLDRSPPPHTSQALFEAKPPGCGAHSAHPRPLTPPLLLARPPRSRRASPRRTTRPTPPPLPGTPPATLGRPNRRNQFSVDQTAGAVPIEYTLKATATPTTATYFVSGSVFVNNVQPGILNIVQLIVQLSSGQQVPARAAGAGPGRPRARGGCSCKRAEGRTRGPRGTASDRGPRAGARAFFGSAYPARRSQCL
jgi:hypothetical protein